MPRSPQPRRPPSQALHPLVKPLTLPEPWSRMVIAHSGSFLLLRPHPPAQTHENTQVFMGRLLAVNGANYMVQAPICNSGDMTFPQALGALGEVLRREGRPRWVGRVAQRPPGGTGGSRCSRKARKQPSGRTSSPSATAAFLTYPFGGLEKQSFPHRCESHSVAPREGDIYGEDRILSPPPNSLTLKF